MTLDDIDLTDSFFDGATALSVPFALLSAVGVGYAEDPRGRREGGLRLHTRAPAPTPRATARVTGYTGQVGGLWPLAVPIMNSISGLHPLDRRPAPPDQRRQTTGRFGASVAEDTTVFGAPARWALDVQRGQRQFLDFAEPTVGTFDEGWLTATAGLVLQLPDDGKGYVMAELRQRDHLFAELHHAKDETARAHAAALFAGYRQGGLRAGLTLQMLSLDPEDRTSTRELADVDGEGLQPWFTSGQRFGLHLDLGYDAPSGWYAESNQRVTWLSPDVGQWSQGLALHGEVLGRVDWTSRSTAKVFGHQRLGARGQLWGDPVALDYDVYLMASQGLNSSGDNSLVFFDAGLRLALHHRPVASTRLFLIGARTPIPITAGLMRLLDPDHLSGSHYAADTLYDTTGGDTIRVDGGLAQTSVYSVAAGLETDFGAGWVFRAQGLAKAYDSTYRLVFDGGPEANGRFVNGTYFLSDGPKRYTLQNELRDTPAYWGGHFQLAQQNPTWAFSVSFSAFNAVGITPFGNGAAANDVGVVNHSTANPNARRRGLANFDGDRAFMVRMFAALNLFEGAWAYLTASHRDGRPFAFIDTHEDRGQVALTYLSTRGSPLVYLRPFSGPREDFRVNVDLGARYTFEVAGQELSASVVVANLLDFGNEISETHAYPAREGRASLELEVPRSVVFTLQTRR